MKLMVVINNKGGVGKTTSAVNLAASFARHGERTLLVDLDPSASASLHLGFDKTVKPHNTICDYFLKQDDKLENYIYPVKQDLFCLPSEPALSEFYDEIQQEEEVEFFLNKKHFGKKYDIILFDSPPNMGNLALNALAIADYALIPVQTQYLALSGLELTLKTIDKAQQYLNRSLKILGIFGTQYDRRTNVAKEVYSELQKRFGKKVFQTVIGTNSKLIEAYNAQKSILDYARSARGSKEYLQLADEILTKMK